MSGAFVDYVRPDKQSGNLIYRRRFPDELVLFIPRADGRGMGRKELRVSLFAKNMDDPGAADRWAQAKAEYDQIVAKAAKAAAVFHKRATGTFDTLSAPQIAYLAEVYRHEWLEADDASRWDQDEHGLFQAVAEQLVEAGGGVRSAWAGREGSRWGSKTRETVEATLADCQTMRANGDLAAILDYWGDEALLLAEAHGSVIDPADTGGLSALCRALNEVAIATSRDVIDRLDGPEYPETPAAPVKAEPEKQSPALSLLALFDGYAAAQEVSPGVRTEWRRYIRIFTEFLGHDDASAISRDDVTRWRDHLLHTPGRTGKLRKPVTVRDKYMTALGCALNWAVEERHLPVNVAR